MDSVKADFGAEARELMSTDPKPINDWVNETPAACAADFFR